MQCHGDDSLLNHPFTGADLVRYYRNSKDRKKDESGEKQELRKCFFSHTLTRDVIEQIVKLCALITCRYRF